MMTIALEMSAKSLKKSKVEELAQLLNSYSVIAIADLHKVRAAQVQEIRKKFRGQLVLKCAKNSLMSRAVDICDSKEKLQDFKKFLRGSSVFIFTNMDPFKLLLLLEKNKVKMPAKAGDIAPEDIVVPAGNTGMPPGPVISEFTELGIQTRIESGSVWISKDAVVAWRGEVISNKLASILARLGIKPIEAGLTLKAAYQDGIIYTAEILKINVETLTQEIRGSLASALNLAVNSTCFEAEALSLILARSVSEAITLSVVGMLTEPEALPVVLAKSYNEGTALLKKLAEKEPSLSG